MHTRHGQNLTENAGERSQTPDAHEPTGVNVKSKQNLVMARKVRITMTFGVTNWELEMSYILSRGGYTGEHGCENIKLDT